MFTLSCPFRVSILSCFRDLPGEEEAGLKTCPTWLLRLASPGTGDGTDGGCRGDLGDLDVVDVEFLIGGGAHLEHDLGSSAGPGRRAS